MFKVNIVQFFLLSIVFGFTIGQCPYNVPYPPNIFIEDPCTDEPVDCYTNAKKLKVRTLDATCNNLDNPRWGAGYYKFARMLPPSYGDGVYSLPLTQKNLPLPNARLLANALFPTVSVPDPNFTLVQMQFGQYLAHDLGSQMDKVEDDGFCCQVNGSWHYCDPPQAFCASVPIPPKDPVYPSTVNCINFVRSVVDRDLYCSKPNSVPKFYPNEQINQATGYIDHSPTYGNNDDDMNAVRLGTDGLLKTVTLQGVKLPSLQSGKTSCTYQNESCFAFGDNRGNTNVGLFVLQTIFYTEHNRIATQLKTINKNWSDDMLYETARKINIGVLQHIAYDHFLSTVLDSKILESKKIVKPNPQNSYVNDYDPYRISGTFNEFTTGANRYFHTQIQGILRLYNDKRSETTNYRLSDAMKRPSYVLLRNGANFREFATGLSYQQKQSDDINFEYETRNFIFRGKQKYGLDLRAVDIMRGRDHGLPFYNDMRERCHLPRIQNFSDLANVMPAGSAKTLSTFYDDVDDIELSVGGALEDSIGSSSVGPTFSCILAYQYNAARVGDRFFYENNGTMNGCEFLPSQINEIKKMTLAKIFCQNVPSMTQIQPNIFKVVSAYNPLMPCSKIADIDFSKWKNWTCTY